MAATAIFASGAARAAQEGRLGSPIPRWIASALISDALRPNLSSRRGERRKPAYR